MAKTTTQQNGLVPTWELTGDEIQTIVADLRAKGEVGHADELEEFGRRLHGPGCAELLQQIGVLSRSRYLAHRNGELHIVPTLQLTHDECMEILKARAAGREVA